MSRVFAWKSLAIAVVSVLVAGFIFLFSGNTDMASALFVVAALEGLFGVAVVWAVRARSRERLARTL